MIDRTKIINAAQKEIGQHENPIGSNKTKFGEWYGLNGVSWCAIYVAYVFDQAGIKLSIDKGYKGFHYVPTLHAKAKQNNWFTKSPKPGDIVLFDFKPDDKKEFAQHVGIYASTNQDGTIMTFEGNTANEDNGSQDNGDQVAFKRRSMKLVLGIVDIEKMLKS